LVNETKNKPDQCLTVSTVAEPAISGTLSYSAPIRTPAITWNEKTFKEYINDPGTKIPRTKMVFTGVRNETDDYV